MIRDLTLALIYLSGWSEEGTPKGYMNAWKGYDFSALKELADKDYIHLGIKPSRNKMITLTPEGANRAKEILDSIRSIPEDMGRIDFVPEEIPMQKQAMRLHLELVACFDQEDLTTLRKYGRMEKSISRDIVVPLTIDLHALHYAIQKVFGWQNSHLHHFELPDEDFQSLTRNKVGSLLPLVGIWFRFPSGDYEDVYWDDDYREGQDLGAWFRKKYRGPYRYGGYTETLEFCRQEVETLKERFPVLQVPDFISETKKERTVALEKATPRELMGSIYFEGSFYELIERNHLRDILLSPGARADSASSVRACSEALETPVPFVDSLLYQYDYGDGWEVRITCENWYYMTEDGQVCDMNGRSPAGDEEENVAFCIQKEAPRCLAADGMSLLDDVGGPRGFCEMLRTINDLSCPEENHEMRDWAYGMGWSERRRPVKRML